jgi:hypothetical protein
VDDRRDVRAEGQQKSGRFQIEHLEERIAPSANLNPGENNTNLQGNQPPNGNSGNTSNNSN